MRLDHVVKYDFILSLFQPDGVNLREKQDWTVRLTSSLNPQTNLTALPPLCFHIIQDEGKTEQSRQERRHSWGTFPKAEPNFCIVLYIQTITLIRSACRGSALVKGAEFSNSKCKVGGSFLGQDKRCLSDKYSFLKCAWWLKSGVEKSTRLCSEAEPSSWRRHHGEII